MVVGVPLGYLAARHQGRPLDTLVVSGSLLGVVTPVFFLAILLKLVFADTLHWLPTALRQDPRIDATHITNFYVLDGILTQEWDAAWDAILHLVLPAVALATIPLAIIVRITRASVAEVHATRTTSAPPRPRGWPSSTISRRHVLRNALLPVVTTIGLQAGLLFAGAVLTETVFAFNGIGQYLFEAIGRRDYPVLQGFILFIAIMYSLINLLVDVSYGVIDPRVQGLHEPSDLPPGHRPARRARTSAEAEVHGVSLWRGAFRRVRRNPSAIAGAIIVLAFVVVAVVAPLLTPYEPGSAEWSGQVTPSSVPGPSEDHWLGLDRFGSDMWTQMVYGARQSLVYGVVSTAIGLIVGATAGARRRRVRRGRWRFGQSVDTFIMRCVDVMLSIPSLLLAVSIAAVLGQNAYSVMIAIGAAQVPIFARLLRGSMLSQGRSDYVLAAGALGLRKTPDRDEPRAAQQRRADDRAGHAQPRDRDHRGGGAVLPRARRVRPRHRRVGADAGRGPGPLRRRRPGSPSCRVSRSRSRRSASRCSVRRCARPSTPGRGDDDAAATRRAAPDRTRPRGHVRRPRAASRARPSTRSRFEIRPGQHVGLVGESGSGKSVTSLAIMGLLPKRGVRTSGEVLCGGRNLLTADRDELSRLRGREIAMVFQDPMTSLNPVVPIGVQVAEVIQQARRRPTAGRPRTGPRRC